MNASRDRISNLPDEVLISILSLLSTKEAVRSCLLAKRWRKTWTFVPVLKFDLDEFLTDRADLHNHERRMECEDQFELFVNGVLETRGTSSMDLIQYRSLISFYHSEATLQWLDHATVLMPQVISVLVERENEFMYFPDSVFSCASLQKLELDFDTNNRTIVSTELINLPSLKFLMLRCVELDDDFIPKLLSGCSTLEFLYLGICDFQITDTCHISSNVLKELTLDHCWHPKQMQISCPGLEYLLIDSDNQDGGLSLENMASLVNAKFGFYLDEFDNDLYLLRGGLSNVSTLRLQLRSAEFQKILEDDIPNCRTFNNMKSLEIERWDAGYDFDLLACFIKNSPSLQEIILHLDGPRKYNPEEEPKQEESGGVLSQREHLEMVRIIRSRDQDLLVNRIINSFRAHIKNIGRIEFQDLLLV